MQGNSFQDKGEGLEAFMDEILIKCPRCSGCARFTIMGEPREPDTTGHAFVRSYFTTKRFAHPLPGKIICPKCGYSKIVEDETEKLKPYLKTTCCGEILWALNERHLGFLEDFVGAKQRRRKPFEHHSLATNLPEWMKSKKNRTNVMKALQDLRALLDRC